MPRKTRREKFTKKLHKLNILTKPSLPASSHVETKKKKHPVVIKTTLTENKDPMEIKIRDFFLYDLRKSLTIIAAILILESALYFASQSGLLKFMN